MTTRFQTLTLTTCDSAQATTPEQVRLVDDVISLPFDGQLHSDAVPSYASADARHVWRMAVVDVLLPATTRRPFVVNVKAALHALHGHALVRISADGRTTSRQVLAGTEMKSADLTLRLHIRRSTQARDRLRLHLWTEANASTENGEAQASVDAVDVMAR
jgi:hypothetical protein